MKVCVTGSAGFVGRHMVSALQARGDHVDRWDITDVNGNALDLFTDTFGYDLIVHAAASQPHRAAIDGDPMHMVRNLRLDSAMFEWAVRTRTRVLYFSSSAVYPVGMQAGYVPYRLAENDADWERPITGELLEAMGRIGSLAPDAAYGWTKLTGEKMAAAAGAHTRVHVVRPFSGYGEDQDERWPFGAFAARVRRRADPFTIWGDGEQVRDWVHIDDVVSACLAIVDADAAGPINICTGVGTSMTELARRMWEHAGYQPRLQLEPGRPAGVAHRVGDPALLHRYYTPKVDLAEGIRRALRAK
jgi:nucleoside-diphosphate-sugar epimerase